MFSLHPQRDTKEEVKEKSREETKEGKKREKVCFLNS